jgi:hypothetical protein
LNLEDSWHTKRCWVRIFTTLLGVIFTDCYFGFMLENDDDVRDNLYRDETDTRLKYYGFLSSLAEELIFNNFDNENVVYGGLRSSVSASPSDNSALPKPIPQLKTLNTTDFVKRKYQHIMDDDIDTYNKRVATYQLRCASCGSKSTQFCTLCSEPELGSFQCFCSARSNKKQCWNQHICTKHL